MSNLTERIRAALQARGRSQAQLAAHLGVSRQAMSLWLHEDPHKRGNVPEDALPRIADYLLVSVDWLRGVTRAGAPQPRPQGETGARYRHTTHAVLIKEFMEKLMNMRPDSIGAFYKTLRVSPDDWVDADYASNRVVLLVAPPRVDANALRAMLWQSLSIKTADEMLGIIRCHVIASPLVTESLVREAEAQGIHLVEYHTAEDLAHVVAEKEAHC